MSFSKTRHFVPKIFEAGLLAKVVENIIGDKPKHVDITDFQDLPDGGNVSHSLNSPFGLATICDISEHRITVFYRTSSDKRQYLFMKMACGLIEVDVGADTPDYMQAVLDLLTKGLDLKEASEEARAKERGPSRKELSERLAVLERIVLGPNRTLQCFLSYRFTPENEDPARKLHSFLILLGIDVVTGNTYEPRPVTFPPKTRPVAWKFKCAVMGPKEEAYDQETPYRRADHRRAEGCASGHWGPRALPQARHLRCHVL